MKTFRDFKKKYKLKNSDMARFFDYKTEASYTNTSGRKRIEAGILNLLEYIRNMKQSERYTIRASEIKPKHWVLTDKQTTLVCIFEHKKFNETQQTKYIEDPTTINAAVIASEVNQMTEWLIKNHAEKLS